MYRQDRASQTRVTWRCEKKECKRRLTIPLLAGIEDVVGREGWTLLSTGDLTVVELAKVKNAMLTQASTSNNTPGRILRIKLEKFWNNWVPENASFEFFAKRALFGVECALVGCASMNCALERVRSRVQCALLTRALVATLSWDSLLWDSLSRPDTGFLRLECEWVIYRRLSKKKNKCPLSAPFCARFLIRLISFGKLTITLESCQKLLKSN